MTATTTLGPKKKLDPREKVLAAYYVLVLEHQQQDVAIRLNVNMGRVNEAIMAVRKAVGLRKDAGYKDRRKA